MHMADFIQLRRCCRMGRVLWQTAMRPSGRPSRRGGGALSVREHPRVGALLTKPQKTASRRNRRRPPICACSRNSRTRPRRNLGRTIRSHGGSAAARRNGKRTAVQAAAAAAQAQDIALRCLSLGRAGTSPLRRTEPPPLPRAANASSLSAPSRALNRRPRPADLPVRKTIWAAGHAGCPGYNSAAARAAVARPGV